MYTSIAVSVKHANDKVTFVEISSFVEQKFVTIVHAGRDHIFVTLYHHSAAAANGRLKAKLITD